MAFTCEYFKNRSPPRLYGVGEPVTLLSLILRAAGDRSFRQALLADPDRALAEHAIVVDAKVRVALDAYVQAARR